MHNAAACSLEKRLQHNLSVLLLCELPDADRKAIERGLPNSSATALTVVDLRPYGFGLTLPPWAVALVPNA
ncbi:hypothetical protein, partial [Microseira wollei]|uniref:hypothetical protein n=1 Tax=Microseira wollei TaxID=467598 RepID=UPI001CFE28BC